MSKCLTGVDIKVVVTLRRKEKKEGMGGKCAWMRGSVDRSR